MKEIKYNKVGDYYFPDLKITSENSKPLGKYGRMRRTFLQENHPGYFFKLRVTNQLEQHLYEVDQQANKMYDCLIKQYKDKWKITEQLKENNQMEWVKQMNLIHDIVDEMIKKEIIFK